MERILITADIVPTTTNYSDFATGNIQNLVGDDLMQVFSDSSFTIMNLETPLTDKLSPIEKCGPCLHAPTNTINGLKKINPFFYTLANNHIMDQNEDGLKATIQALEKNGIQFAGVGKNISEASKPFQMRIGGKSIGIYCCVEHEFSIATDKTPGANPYDPLFSYDHVKELKNSTDYVIVLYHGGKEQYRYPSPRLQQICRKFIDSGADLVVCQHSHCVGCEEKYDNGRIIYGQGNFLFDLDDNEYWNTGLVIELKLGENIDIKYIPIEKHGAGVRLAKNPEKILADFYERSKHVGDKDFLEQQYSKFALEALSDYEQHMLGKLGRNIFFRAINKLTGYKLANKYFSKEDLLALQNYFMTEAHSELVIEAIKTELKRR